MGGIVTIPQFSDELARVDDLVASEGVTGLIDGINTHYDTNSAFRSGTLSVYIDGRKLTELDYQESLNLHGFDLIIDTNDPQRLQRPLRDSEEIRVSYVKSRTSGSICIKTL